MKKYLKYITLSAVAVALMPLAACSDDDTVDPYSVNYVYLYQPDETYAAVEYKANGTFLNDFQDPLTLMPVRLTKPAPSDITVEVAIDESLVDEYNAANGTEYTFLNGATIVNPTMTIAQGKYITTDSIKVSFADRSGFMKDAENLILPVVIKSATGNVTISESSRIFLTYNSTYRANKVSIDAPYLSVDTDADGWQSAYSSYTITDFAKAEWAADDAITLALQIDPALVATYNSENGTEYKTISASLASSQITIAAGKQTADLQFTIGDYTGVANDEEYLVPIKVTSFNGVGAELTNDVVYFEIINTPPTYTASTNAAALGTAITPGAWSLVCDTDAYDYTTSTSTRDLTAAVTVPGNQLLNIDAYTTVTLDMGSVNTVKGFSFTMYAWYYSTTSFAKVETSTDGSKWNEWTLSGSFPSSQTTIACQFAKQISCQYIRVKFGAASYSDQYGAVIKAMYIY